MKYSFSPFIFGTGILAFGIFIAKVIGAVYKILLTDFIGGGGLGIYQLVFPLYGIFLSISGGGVPTALSKVIAENKYDKEKCLSVSVKIFGKIGIACAIITLLLSYPMSYLQGKEVTLGYLIIAPSIIASAIISCYKGYFQGVSKMMPTAITDITEVLVKVLTFIVIGLVFKTFSVYTAFISVSVAEFIALIIMFLLKRRIKTGGVLIDSSEKDIKKEILSLALPVTVLSLMIPFSQFIEGIIMINGLKEYTSVGTSLFGLYSGTAVAVVGLPVSVLYSLSSSSVPYIAREKEEKLRQKKIIKVLSVSFILSAVSAVMLYFGANVIVSVLFRNLSSFEKETVIKLIKVMSVNVITMTVMQVGNSVLLSTGKKIYPIVSLGVGTAVKFIILTAMITLPSLNVFAGAYSLIACYFSASLLNLYLILRKEKPYENKALKLDRQVD